jgi:drug/metabolite transporter (DMT)-like permease
MRFKNAILFLVLASIWGGAFTAIKMGLEYFPPILFAALRYDIAGFLMLLYAGYVRRDHYLPQTSEEWIVTGVGGALLIAAYHAFLFVGEQGTTSAAAAIVVSLSPILTTAFARVLLPQSGFSRIGIVGLVIGFVGVVVLTRPSPANILNSRTVSLFLIFLAAASFALGSVVTRWIDSDLPIETMEAWSMVFGALLMHGFSLYFQESVSAVEWTTRGTLALGYLALIASLLGFLIYFTLLDRLGPIEINLVSYAAPVTAAATGFLFLGERPTIFTALGFLLIFIGFVLMKYASVLDIIQN